ncbi:MAG: hypothetical protein E7218_04830 [Anaerofustis stercorihominis]|nr:hypothetical protein [Anaerofustis stercorihominis]
MENFGDTEYSRFDISSFEADVISCVRRIESEDISSDDIDDILRRISTMYDEFDSKETISYIRHTLCMTNEEYKDECMYYAGIRSKLSSLLGQLYSMIKAGYPQNEIRRIPLSDYPESFHSATYIHSDDRLGELFLKEAMLISEYERLLNDARVSYGAKSYTLGGISSYFKSTERNIRQKAFYAYSDFFRMNEEKIDGLFDELVKVRHEIAVRSGFDNYTEYSSCLKHRSFTREDISLLRSKICEFIVPVRDRLNEKKAEELNIPSVRYYDEEYYPHRAEFCHFAGEIFRNVMDICSRIPQFSGIVRATAFDVFPKRGKMNGSYCAYVKNKDLPFVFANITGSYADYRVLFHEISHAVGIALSGRTDMGVDIAEFCAYGGEMLLCGYGGEEDKFFSSYKKDILIDKINFVPYGILCDEFENNVYDAPFMSPSERKDMFAELERKYMPDGRYEDSDILRKGTYWYRQAHIFTEPFYYIDYVPAALNAMELYIISEDDLLSATEKYLKFAGENSLLYSDRIVAAGLSNVFGEDSIKKVITPVIKELEISLQ